MSRNERAHAAALLSIGMVMSSVKFVGGGVGWRKASVLRGGHWVVEVDGAVEGA